MNRPMQDETPDADFWEGAGGWHHIAITKTGLTPTIEVYVDGLPEPWPTDRGWRVC